jgi:seryl-tRNA synthetase
MLDPNLLRKDLDLVVAALQKRKNPQQFLDVAAYSALEAERKTIQTRTEELQNKRNTVSKQVGVLMALAKQLAGEEPDQAEFQVEQATALKLEAAVIGEQLQSSANRNNEIAAELQSVLMTLPNLPHESVPVGAGEDGNVEVRRWGIPKSFDFTVKDHVDVGAPLGLDADTGAKLSGARFTFMKGSIAKLHRALAQFMLDVQTNEHGYTECYTPYIVNRDVLEGTGQLPKFEEDMFWVTRGGDETQAKQYLISTSEISLTNSVRDSVLAESDLPIKLTAHSPCFRSEAGSYGRDTKGMIRQHQFDKVEMVQIHAS